MEECCSRAAGISGRIRKAMGAVIPIASFYVVLAAVGVPCPLRYLFGISCAGCGMTRAWKSLISLDLAAAVYYHPLFPVPALAAAVWLFRDRIPDRMYKALTAAAIVLFLSVYIVRMLSPDDTVVYFAPEEGFIARLFARVIYSV